MQLTHMRRGCLHAQRLMRVSVVVELDLVAEHSDRVVLASKQWRWTHCSFNVRMTKKCTRNRYPANLSAPYRIFDGSRHPFYEHRIAA